MTRDNSCYLQLRKFCTATSLRNSTGLCLEVGQDLRMDERCLRRSVHSRSTITVALTDELGTTRYAFRGTRVSLSSMVDDPDGKKQEAKGSYDLIKEFGI